MTVFVHQNKFFSKEYFGSSFKIILVVFYVLNFWDTDFLRRVTVQNDFFLLQWPDGLGGLPGVTPHTNFYFISLKKNKKNILDPCFFPSALVTWQIVDGIIWTGNFKSNPCRARPFLFSYWIAVSVTRLEMGIYYDSMTQ